ncbi:MAG: damage-inducible protein DinB [Rhodobiaceae bacterium]|nr:MAG: damage-inducible protein DinB [Rhodobiaceae bacterium]
MSYKPVACEMARYNKWQNESLLGLCDDLSAEELGKDKGLFFGSLLSTLEHILYADRTLIGFFTTGVRSAFDPNAGTSENYEAYRADRLAEDAHILSLCTEAGDNWFEETFEFYSPKLGKTRPTPRWFYAAQMFNHQTHHRSQITSVLHGMGLDYGNTDVPYNPLSEL